MKRVICFALLLGLVGQAFAAGPFGFEKGMTREQIIQLVGKNAVDVQFSIGNILSVNTAPKPDPAFDSFLLLISPTEGLLSIDASGKLTDSTAALQKSFTDIVSWVNHNYGSAASTSDKCIEWATCKTVSWQLKKPDNHVVNIEVKAKKLGSDLGLVNCAFQFEGYRQYVEGKH
jgi:hypothetical protein